MTTITNAVYKNSDNQTISAEFNGKEMTVPVNPDNRHYAEIVEQEIEIAPYVEPEPTWYDLIAATDKEMPRYMEDYLDSVGAPESGRVKDNYDAKKILRGQQP
jgi:hypothetical protein